MLGFDRGGSSGDPIGSGQDLFITTEQLLANAGVIWPFSAAVSRRPLSDRHMGLNKTATAINPMTPDAALSVYDLLYC
jgi:hypothetical protein